MIPFETKRLPDAPDVSAPDGSDVRIFCGLAGGGMAHFSLPAAGISRAVRHRSVEEIWFVVSGAGEMWRRRGDHQEVTALTPGVSLTIPVGTAFQFRASDVATLNAVAITMPPWPGSDEAEFVPGAWSPTVYSGAGEASGLSLSTT